MKRRGKIIPGAAAAESLERYIQSNPVAKKLCAEVEAKTMNDLRKLLSRSRGAVEMRQIMHAKTIHPTRIRAEHAGETRWFDTLAEAQDWIAEQEAEEEAE
jgi:hypothetical protein